VSFFVDRYSWVKGQTSPATNYENSLTVNALFAIMSRAFVESFFPALTSQLSSPTNRIRPIYEFLLPVDVMQLCPEVTVRMDFLVLRNPVLLLGALFGAVFGLYVSLFHEAFGFIPLSVTNKSVGRPQSVSLFWMSVSFLFFGLMNVAAIPLHSFLPVFNPEGFHFKRTPLPQQYPFLWIMDAYCTGVFSSALTMFAYGNRPHQSPAFDVDRHRGLLLPLLLLLGCLPIAKFLVHGSTVELELWYLLPVAFCATYYSFDLFQVPRLRPVSSPTLRRRSLVSVCIAVFLLLLVGLFLDAPLCRWSTQQQNIPSIPWFGDAGRLPAVAFVACDLAFIGLFLEWRQDIIASRPINKKIHRE
jgi:hypothetical protein